MRLEIYKQGSSTVFFHPLQQEKKEKQTVTDNNLEQ